jgi:hypothetical protein
MFQGAQRQKSTLGETVGLFLSLVALTESRGYKDKRVVGNLDDSYDNLA